MNRIYDPDTEAEIKALQRRVDELEKQVAVLNSRTVKQVRLGGPSPYDAGYTPRGKRGL